MGKYNFTPVQMCVQPSVNTKVSAISKARVYTYFSNIPVLMNRTTVSGC